MISTEEIKKLADLARIEVGEEEALKLALEIDAILGFVGQISTVTGDKGNEVELGSVHNIWREDMNPTEPGTYSKELVAGFPENENDYLKVKKIL